MQQSFNGAGEGVFVSLLAWLQGTLLGSIATTFGVIAIALVGFMMLSGRIDLRRATHAILGCFILFGASTLARGIMKAVSQTSTASEVTAVQPPAAPLPVPASGQQSPVTAFDPYAGATVTPPSR